MIIILSVPQPVHHHEKKGYGFVLGRVVWQSLYFILLIQTLDMQLVLTSGSTFILYLCMSQH